MESKKKDEVIECEYVYDQNKDVDQRESTMFSGEYYKEDDDKDGIQHRQNTKKRTSRYDEEHYALPDSDDEAELTYVKSKLKASEAQLVIKEKHRVIWKTAACVSTCILLFSITGIVYLIIEKVN